MGRLATLCTLLVLAACTGPGAAGGANPHSSPAAAAFPAPGGCAGTTVSYGEPPAWAQGGFEGHVKGTPWQVPWALGSPADAVGYVFAGELVAGGDRSDGSANKVLWVANETLTSFVVEGHPLGQAQPVITVAGGPSIVDPPTPGCWTFRLTWPQRASTINLMVLPHGSLPA